MNTSRSQACGAVSNIPRAPGHSPCVPDEPSGKASTVFRDPHGGHCDHRSGHTVGTAPSGSGHHWAQIEKLAPPHGPQPAEIQASARCRPRGRCAQSALADLFRSPQGPRVSHTLLLSYSEKTPPQPPPLKFFQRVHHRHNAFNCQCCDSFRDQSGDKIGQSSQMLCPPRPSPGRDGDCSSWEGPGAHSRRGLVLRPGPHPGRMLTHGT